MANYKTFTFPANEPMVDRTGRVTPAWRIFFKNIPANALQTVNDLSNTETNILLKANKVAIPESGSLAGRLPQLDADGDISDSGIVKAEAQTAAVDVTAIAAPLGSDRINITTFNTSLTTLTTEINALVAVVNDLITKLKTSGIMES